LLALDGNRRYAVRVALWLLLAVPLIDLWLLIEVGRVIGAGRTFLLMLLIAIAGLMAIRRLGLATLLRARERMVAGEPPSREMLDAALLTAGGVLLLIPGFVTDVMALVCLLPPLRRWLAQRLFARAGRPTSPGRVIEGEYRREDSEQDRR